ncbi:MAG: zinc-ribbon domain-containing protein [Erysipelotrichaceae bacterium]|nr:zinc-ribbon domain-containing protein [Erysipelotrichaceae bacterium]
MKCWKCGKEIPDDREYCGYCGAKQKKETSVLDDEQKEQPVSADQDASETKNEDPVKEKTEESVTVETEKPDSEKEDISVSEKDDSTTDTAEEKADVSKEDKEENTTDSKDDDNHPESVDNISVEDTTEKVTEEADDKDNLVEEKETADSNTDEESSDETEDVSDDKEETQSIPVTDDTQDAEFTNSEEDHKEEKKWKMPDLSEYGITINAEDFHKVFAKIRRPLEDQPFNGVSAVISFIVIWIVNWITFRSFGTGFIITAVLVIGVMILMAVENHDQFNWQKAFNQSCETVTSGALPMIIGGILLDSAAGQSSYSFIHLFSTSFFGMFFILLAGVIFISEIFRTRKFNKYAEVVLTAFIILVVLWIASATNPNAFISLFH